MLSRGSTNCIFACGKVVRAMIVVKSTLIVERPVIISCCLEYPAIVPATYLLRYLNILVPWDISYTTLTIPSTKSYYCNRDILLIYLAMYKSYKFLLLFPVVICNLSSYHIWYIFANDSIYPAKCVDKCNYVHRHFLLVNSVSISYIYNACTVLFLLLCDKKFNYLVSRYSHIYLVPANILLTALCYYFC